jgi:hypothetical protein
MPSWTYTIRRHDAHPLQRRPGAYTAYDVRNDYYTEVPTIPAPWRASTMVGFGPNTRTIMQVGRGSIAGGAGLRSMWPTSML